MKILTLLAFFILFLIVSCSKPSADFTSDKQEYTAGDVVVLKDKSKHAHDVRWTLPDETTSKESEVSINTDNYKPLFALPPTLSQLTFTVKLEAFSRSGSKSDFVVKSIKVNAPPIPNGFLTFYRFNTSGTSYSVSIDGGSLDPILLPEYGKPSDCNKQGYTTFTLTPGEHTYMYKYLEILSNKYNSVTGKTDVTSNSCTYLQIY